MAKNLFSILNDRFKKNDWSFVGRPPYESDDIENAIDSNEEECSPTSNSSEGGTEPEEAYYFIDGAERRLKIGYAESEELGPYPLYVGDVAICCGQLLTNKSFHCFRHSHYLCYAFPVQLMDHAGSIKECVEEFRKQFDIIQEPTLEILFYNKEEDPMARIHRHMRSMEEELLISLLKKDINNVYIFIDGHFPWNDKQNENKEYDELKKLCLENNVISVDKEFSYSRMKDNKMREEIKKLQSKENKESTSTSSFYPKGKSIVLWYQKLRNDSLPEEPSSDIVECAIPYDETQPDEKEKEKEKAEWESLLKRLSCPTCYGLEKRWRTHVYPMYLTERCCKEIQISETLLKRLIYGG